MTACFTIKNGPINRGCDMKIFTMHDFDEGCKHPEDDNSCFISQDGVFAFVVDGCSEPYFGSQFKYPSGLTGGQIVSQTVKQAFSFAGQNDSLEAVVLRANEDVWRVQKKHRGKKVLRDDAATLANASFSCVKFKRQTGQLEVVWGGDVFTIWKTKSGKVGIFGGDNRASDLEREKIYADMVASAKSNPEKENIAKQRYWLHELSRLKREQDNVLYACLNGSPEVSKHWHKEVISEPVELVVLVSDGAWIPMEDWENNPTIAEDFVQVFEAGGWNRALSWVREQQNHGLASQRVKRPEAAGLAIFAD